MTVQDSHGLDCLELGLGLSKSFEKKRLCSISSSNKHNSTIENNKNPHLQTYSLLAKQKL